MVFRQAFFSCLLVSTLAFAAPNTKIEPKLTVSLKENPSANVFIRFQGGNQLAVQQTERLRFYSREEKITHLVEGLKSLSESSQQNALRLLQANSSFSAVSFSKIWVANVLYVKGASAQLVYQLAALPEVVEVLEERVISLEPVSFNQTGGIAPLAEWNMEKIEADKAWQLPGGNNGQGVVVANIDTGVRVTHEALKNNHRANYGWFDPYSATDIPEDSQGHGTHTMGIIAGSGGIGVAPGAQWIACRGCDLISCTQSALLKCGQWVLCPTLPNGSAEDCSKAPRIVSNSWGGGQGNDFYNEVIDAWKTANIIPVFAAGNSGSTCGTIGSPGDQDVIAVASTTAEDNIAGSSSAGPTIDGRIKPEISAPGALIRSAWNTDDQAYQTISGSSMATPHVAGAAALLLSQNPKLTYTQVKQFLENNADRNLVDTGRTCGGIPSTEFPNNQYGHGRLNARKALEDAIGQH